MGLNTMTHFTKTEAMKRLRACKAVGARENGFTPRALTAEVGLRERQDESIYPTFDAEAIDAIVNRADDDLSYPIGYFLNEECRRYGSIVHLYLYEREHPGQPGWGGELIDTITCWLGTPQCSPMVRVPGMKGWIEVG